MASDFKKMVGYDEKKFTKGKTGLDLLKARQQNRLGLRMCNAWNNLPQIKGTHLSDVSDVSNKIIVYI